MQTSFLAEGPDYPRARRLLGLSGPNAKVCKNMQVHANLHKSECMALNKMCSAILVPINWRRSKNFNTCSSRGSSIKCNPITCLHHNKSKSYIQNPETQNNKFETKLSRSARDCCAILGIWESRRASLQAVTSKWHNLSSLTK